MMDLLIALTAVAVMITFIMAGQNRSVKVSRDVKRTTSVKQIQKALALYMAENQQYPVHSGCINGSDALTKALEDGRFLAKGAGLVDPTYPDDLTKCLIYQGTGNSYSIRYTLETSSGAGEPGEHFVTP